MTHNLKEYRDAKVLVPQLTAIIRIVDLSIAGLSFYRGYIPVSVILHTLKEERIVLQIYQSKYKKILESKGKINEKTT